MVGKFKGVFCFFVVLLTMFGCGGDDEESIIEESPSEKIIGSWELVSINGKSPKTDAQDSEDDLEIIEAGEKLVFAADGSLFIELSGAMKARVEDSTIVDGWLLDFTIRMYFKATISGSYVISTQTIEFISGDRANVDFDFSIDDSEDIPKLKELEQEIKEWLQEFAQELEQEFVSELELELDTHKFDFNGDSLTLRQGNERKVYRKK